MTSAAPESGGQGYNESYQYDAIGNLIFKPGIGFYAYGASASGCSASTPPTKPHAVWLTDGNYAYTYDCNGNMTQRKEGAATYNQTWDTENRLSGISGAASATFVYDGDGNRVKATVGSVTTVYMGNYYEQSGTTIKKYYYAGGQRVAMRDGSTVYFLLGDHLGSTAITANASGGLHAELRYKPWGETRYTSGTTPTTYRFTGQRSEEASLGSLYFYNARYYSPSLNRWIQPDTIVPDPSNPQTLNRYAYVNNNPVKYNDPSGHCLGVFAGIDTLVCLLLIGGGVVAGGLTYEYYVGPSVGQRPDHKGVEAANERWATIAGAALDVDIPPIVLGAGIAVQSQWHFAPIQGMQDAGERALGDNNPSQGIAQLTPGEARYFANGVYAPFDDDASTAALGNKIKESVAACMNCSITDQFIVMGLAQNSFLPDSVAALPRIQGSNQVDWNTVFNGDPSHLWSKEITHLWTRGIRGESTSWLRFILQAFTNDLLELQAQGWEMPAGVNISYMQCLASGTSNSCTP